MQFVAAAAAEVESREEGGAFFVTLNRPQARNALSLGVLAALRTIFESLAGRNDLSVAVLTGAGDKAFASGGDLGELGALRSEDEARALSNHGKAALNAIRDCPIPVVAAVNGLALGGGAELALACDWRVAAASASLGFIHARLAIAPSWGGGVDLMRTVGASRGLELLSTGEVLSAEKARDLGLVDRIGDADRPFAEVVHECVEPFRRQPPQVARAIKALSRGERGRDRAALQSIETDRFVEVWTHPDHWQAADLVINRKRKDAA